MHITIPDFNNPRKPEPPAMVSTALRSDVTWNRRVFKAPPLVVALPNFDDKTVMEELHRAIRAE